MNVTILTPTQQAQAAINKAALAVAQAAYTAALQTHLNHLRTSAAAGSPPDVPINGRVQLSDDGTTVITG